MGCASGDYQGSAVPVKELSYNVLSYPTRAASFYTNFNPYVRSGYMRASSNSLANNTYN